MKPTLTLLTALLLAPLAAEPSIAVSRGGRLWAAWFSGTTPGEIIERCPNAYVVVSTSGDGGKTWKEVASVVRMSSCGGVLRSMGKAPCSHLIPSPPPCSPSACRSRRSSRR